MNERLEQMMLKAAEDMPQCYYVPPQYWEKFAELIVEECADIAAKNQAENMNWDIAEIIKEHFGVEE